MAIPRLGYVPGGAPLNVARAIQARNRSVRPVKKRIISPMRPAAPPVDPLWNQANKTVMGFMNPMLSRLAAQRVAAEANARKTSVAHGDALSQALVQSAKPIDESYNRGIVASSTVNDALANRLNAQGGAAQQNLSSQLAQIGAADNQAVSGMYQGASNAGFASGAADLQQLIAERAAGGAYQAKLPGIGRLEGQRDLLQSLSEMRENFGEQERGLQDQASEQSFSLWNTLRGEKREDQVNRQEQLAAQQELYAKQKMALAALAATATTKAQERQFKAQQEALDRQNAQAIASIRADASMYGADVRATTAANKPVKPPAAVGPANQRYIPDGKGGYKPNPNYATGPGRGTNSAVQNRLKGNQAATNMRKLLLNPQTGKPKLWVQNASNDELVRTIDGAIEQAGISKGTPLAIKQKKAMFKLLGIPTGPQGNPYYPTKRKPPTRATGA